jgi:hypothetical protein
MLGGFATLGAQLSRQRNTLRHVLPGAFSGALDALLLGRDPQFAFVKPQHDFIADFYPKSFAEGGRYYHPTVLAHTHSGFLIHGRIIAV